MLVARNHTARTLCWVTLCSNCLPHSQDEERTGFGVSLATMHNYGDNGACYTPGRRKYGRRNINNSWLAGKAQKSFNDIKVTEVSQLDF